jgi:hypothetical protein
VLCLSLQNFQMLMEGRIRISFFLITISENLFKFIKTFLDDSKKLLLLRYKML